MPSSTRAGRPAAAATPGWIRRVRPDAAARERYSRGASPTSQTRSAAAAPIVHEDRFTDAALHARPKEPARKRSRKADPDPPVQAPAPDPAVLDGAAEDVPDHPPLAPPRPAPRRPGLIPTEIADSIGPVLGKAVADIKAHEDGSRRGGDIEDVHKMRVATPPRPAYLKAARPALDKTATDRLRGDVRELAGTLGVIRDHDVMIDRLHREAARSATPTPGSWST